jgi:hypothetical protein
MTRNCILMLAVGILFLQSSLVGQPNVDEKKQGFSMRLWLDNRGVMGRQAYPGTIPTHALGLEYPVGTNIEHLFGGGVWIGGLLDTSTTGTSPPLRLVTTGYQGWTLAGQLYETFPGSRPADTIWVASRRDTVKPAGWDEYWQGALPFNPISDQDFYCMYTDYEEPVPGHIPMNLKIIQSSYSWNDPYADAIIIIEYRIINEGTKLIDSAYIGFFFEPDVGPTNVTSYWVNNFSEYIRNSQTAYAHNPLDAGSTPVGVALLSPGENLVLPNGDTLRDTFRWYRGQDSPTPDEDRYNLMSSGIKDSSEFPQLSDTRFNFAFGPFFIQPDDTLKVAVAVISGFSRRIDHRIVLQNNAARARDIYLNQGIRLPPTPPSPPLRVNVGFRRVELDWKWRLGDDSLYAGHNDPRIYGRPNPEANWDSTNLVARLDPRRYSAPHPIGHETNVDTTQGGRNFEAYRIWRSEHPQFPDASFTLLKQFDVPADSFEFNTGLQYTFVDSNLVRGKTYVYSVTSVSIPNLTYREITPGVFVEIPVDPLGSGIRVNATAIDLPFSVSDQLDKVMVVPNPYRTDRDYTLESGGYEGPFGGWDENRRLIKFINLPEVCTLRIFSLSGDLIRTVEHDGRSATGISRGDLNVPLVSESNRALASGIYLFTVESNLGVQTGKFVIIR